MVAGASDNDDDQQPDATDGEEGRGGVLRDRELTPSVVEVTAWPEKPRSDGELPRQAADGVGEETHGAGD